MVPGSRGSASVFVLVVATALLLFGAWYAFGARDPRTERALADRETAREAGPAGPDAAVLADRADALSKLIEKRKGTPGIPTAVRFQDMRGEPAPPPDDPPDVTDLEGGLVDDAIRLTWRAAGGSPAAGYLVEEVGDGGEALSRERLDADQRSWSDEPVTALAGSRNFRVTAIAGDGTVAEGEQKRVSFSVTDFEVDFLGGDPDGRGSFRVVWDRAGSRVAGTFAVESGGEIGDAVPAAEGRPALDLSTGWRFAGFAGRREIVPREVEVPRFSPDGSLFRDPDTGEVVFENRTARVPRVEIGAEVVLPDDGAGGPRWLPKAKD